MTASDLNSARARDRSSVGVLRFAIALGVVLAVMHPEAGDMARQWTWSSSYHHGWVAAPITLWLLSRASAPSDPERPLDWRGLAVLALALFLMAAGRLGSIQILGHFSLVVAIIGAAVLTLGAPYVRRSAFAFGYLVFMVPFGESLIPALQNAAAIAVAAMLNLAGVETLRDGLILTTDAGRFEMAESCAGLRFLLAALMIATLAAHLAFTSVRRQLAFVLASVALAIAANWLRAFLIVALSTVSDMRFGAGPEHVGLGWVLYGALLIALLVLARRLGDRPLGARLAVNSGMAPQGSVVK
ncbi:MAG: exosortase A [Parvularculaceae bacterium]